MGLLWGGLDPPEPGVSGGYDLTWGSLCAAAEWGAWCPALWLQMEEHVSTWEAAGLFM